MPMKRTRSDESAANPNQTIKQYSFRLSAQLYEEASALYRRLGIPISTALSEIGRASCRERVYRLV